MLYALGVPYVVRRDPSMGLRRPPSRARAAAVESPVGRRRKSGQMRFAAESEQDSLEQNMLLPLSRNLEIRRRQSYPLKA